MSWNRAPASRSQRLRAGYLLAGARWTRTRGAHRTPGASARVSSLDGSVSKMVFGRGTILLAEPSQELKIAEGPGGPQGGPRLGAGEFLRQVGQQDGAAI